MSDWLCYSTSFNNLTSLKFTKWIALTGLCNVDGNIGPRQFDDMTKMAVYLNLKSIRIL